MVQGPRPLSERALRVAFTHISPRLWAGGYNYQRNLFVALDCHCSGVIAPVVFAGKEDDGDELAALSAIPRVEVVQSSTFDRRSRGIALALTLGIDTASAAEFASRRIDVVFESARFFGWRLPLPALAWIPDLQHLRHPEMFSPLARWRRELGFRVQIASGRQIVLSSESARNDCREYYPAITDRVSVVRFASQPEPGLLAADPVKVAAQYGLPSAFFFLPNQFWRHKNHQIVIDALTILKTRGEEVIVAASGSSEDPREPGYFDRLMATIEQRGLRKNFRYLGMIPLDHVYALLRAATALVNPSRFEGWSTTVEEAKSFGVPTIVSDIEVHREQTGGEARYFGIDDAQALADHLSDAYRTSQPVVRGLLPNVDARVAAFAADFARVVRTAAA
jgi:glycosyltransferase involved in cell wall biosynthesis